MNLREAIEAGAQRVARRCRYDYIRKYETDGGDIEYEACALGAAYLGCHPGVTPEDAMQDQKSLSRWVNDLDRAIGVIGGRSFVEQVYLRNDNTIDEHDVGWTALLARYDLENFGTMRMAQVEICAPEVSDESA